MTTYSISLDDVDIVPLPVRTQRHNDFLKKEHFEFHVLKKDVTKEPIVFYTCHICDVQVPMLFASEHGVSIKHCANAHIASEAASRLRAFAVAPPLTPSTSEPIKFCANCSTIVDEDHEKTKEHAEAVMNDKLLWDLMNAYVKENGSKGLANTGIRNDRSSKDNPNVIDIDQDGNLDGNGEIVTDNAATYTFIDSTSKQYVTTTKVVAGKNKQTVVPESSRGFRSLTKAKELLEETATNKENYAKQLRDKHANDSYIELLCKVNNINHLQCGLRQSGHGILIFKGNEIIHVPADNFHSIVYDKKGNALCVLCKARFHADDTDTHKYDMIHMNQVVNVCDNNYIRKVQFGTRHCIICNLKLKKKQVDAHVKSRQHIENKTLYTETINEVTAACNQNENTDIIKNAANISIVEASKDFIEDAEVYTDTNNEKVQRTADKKEGIHNINNNLHIERLKILGSKSFKTNAATNIAENPHNITYKEGDINIGVNENIPNGKKVLMPINCECPKTETDVNKEDEIAGNKEEIPDHGRYTETKTYTIKEIIPDEFAGNNSINKDTANESSASEIPYSFIKVSEKSVLCTLCDCELSNTLKSIRAHVVGRKHKRIGVWTDTGLYNIH